MGEKYIEEMYVSTLERTIKRLWILCILLVVVAVASNTAWIWYESQFEDMVQTTATQDIDAGNGSAIVHDGVHINGEN